ncbi:MAG TPA: ABC transporter permease [Reyranella sp.]|nr:ABC transporter permease [Reyranella sp.]
MTSRGRGAGVALLAAIALVTAAAGYVAPHDPGRQFADFSYAPPMLPRVVDANGRWRRPFVYPLRLADRLERRFSEDRDNPMTIHWFSPGALAQVDESRGPWLLLGGDALGRDIFARVVRGARLSLGVSIMAAAGALLMGAFAGALAGFSGGWADDLVMRIADIVLILPAIYVVIVLRAAMPLVLSTSQVFLTLVVVLALAGWPYVARGVRAVVAAERGKEYAEAARAIGAGWWRILLRHLLPASRGFLAVQATLLMPAFILAEATLSFVGFGFAEPTPSWGVMLQGAGQTGTLVEAPWLLSPAAAIVLSVLALYLAAGSDNPPLRSGEATSPQSTT